MQKVKLFSLSAVVILLLLIINCAPSLKKYYDCRFEKTSLGIILPDTMQLFFGFKGKRASLKEEDSVLLLIKDRITAEIDSFTKFGKKSVITIKSKNCKSLSVKPHGALSRFSVYDSLCYLGSVSKPQFMLYLQNLKIYKYEEMQNLYIPNPFSPAPIIAIVAINVANASIIEQVECIEESFDYLIWDNDLKTIVKSGKVKSKACISLKYKAIEGDQRITNIHIALVKEIFKKTPFTKLLEAGDFK